MLRGTFGERVPESAFIIRHTEVEQFLDCPRKWRILSHNGLNLEPVLRNPKLRFGICWHYALEQYYRHGADIQAALRGLAQSYREETKRLEDFYGLVTDDLEKELDEETMLCKLLLQEYHTEESLGEFDYEICPDRLFSVEERLLVPIFNTRGNQTRAYLAARLDLVQRQQWDSRSHMHVDIIDHKSRSKSTNVREPKGLSLDLQMGLQMLAFTVAHHPVKVRGAVHNLVRKQQPGPRVRSPIFGRHLILRGPKELQNLHKYLLHTYSRMKEELRVPLGESTYCPDALQCNWKCPAQDVCESINKGEDYEFLLETNFQPREKTLRETLKEEMEVT